MPLLTLTRPVLGIWPAIICICVCGWLSACTKKPRMPITTCGAGQSLVDGQCVTKTQPAKATPNGQENNPTNENKTPSENDQPTEDTGGVSEPDDGSDGGEGTAQETGGESGTDPKLHAASLGGGTGTTARQAHPPITFIPAPEPGHTSGKGGEAFPPNPTIRKGSTSSSPMIDYYDADGGKHSTTLCYVTPTDGSKSQKQFTTCLGNNAQRYHDCVLKNGCGAVWK